MIDPDPDLVVELLDAADGRLRMVTIAPERPGALEVIRMLVDAGVVVAVGHTDASYDETRAAVDAGARVATHLGNAMRPLHHRRPGPIAACLESADVACELIADGHHLDPGFVRFVAATKGAAATVLITDAMAAAGQPDGRYALGSLDVDVIDGVATLVDGDTLAGSTLTMDAAVRNAVSWGIPIETARRLPRVRLPACSASMIELVRSRPASGQISWCSTTHSMSTPSSLPATWSTVP